jgi:hypothetical protein
MFAITKLTAASQAFLAEMAATNGSRSAASSIALAKALTFCVNLPSSPIEDIDAFYRSQIEFDLQTKISTINEIMLLDVKTVQDYCMKFYMLRYQTAHPGCRVFCFNTETAVEDFFGITRCFDSATLTLVKENAAILTNRVNKFRDMIDQLFTAEQTSDSGAA